MFDIGFFEVLIIMATLVVVIGPQNLTKLAKAVGKGLGEIKELSPSDLFLYSVLILLAVTIVANNPYIW